MGTIGRGGGRASIDAASAPTTPRPAPRAAVCFCLCPVFRFLYPLEQVAVILNRAVFFLPVIETMRRGAGEDRGPTKKKDASARFRPRVTALSQRVRGTVNHTIGSTGGVDWIPSFGGPASPRFFVSALHTRPPPFAPTPASPPLSALRFLPHAHAGCCCHHLRRRRRHRGRDGGTREVWRETRSCEASRA